MRQIVESDLPERRLGWAERKRASDHQPSGDQKAYNDSHAFLGLSYFYLRFDFLT